MYYTLKTGVNQLVKSLLGNDLINFIKGKKTGKYKSISSEEREHLQSIVDDFVIKKSGYGSDFNIKDWASGIDILNDKSVDFLSNIKDGDNIMEGLANSMGKTTKAVTSSGAEIELTGNKYKDFFNKTKESLSTFGKVAKNGLKSFGLGLLGTVANIGINAAVGYAIEAAISAWQKYSNMQETAIEKSQNATQKLQENQNKIKSTQSVLNDIQSNKVIDTNGNEITRFEQLSRGVNSLGENVSLTASEFEEYNSILNSMTGAGLNATTSMANLEKQVKDLRRSANSDSLTGLGDWVEGFNAKNNQMYTNATKEVGFQQKLSALNKIYNDPEDASDKIEQVTQMGFWEKLANNIATGEMAIAAGQTASEEARESLLNSADKIRDELVASETDIKALEEIAKEYSIDIFDDNGKIDYGKYKSDKVQEQLADVRANLESQVESMVRESSGFLQAMFENSPEFKDISSTAANAIGQIFGNIDYDTISKYMLDSNGMLSQQMMKDWVKDISEGAKDKGVQEQLSQLFNLDAESNNKTFKAYEKQANQLLNGITQKVPGISKELLKNATGIEDTLNSARQNYKKVLDTVGFDFAKQLNLNDLKLAADIISQQDVENAQQLSKAMQAAKEAAFDINANPLFDKIAVTKETANSGDDYVKATTYLKEAKEMFDKGLVGTDDFKSIAKYFSPTGSEDPANFLENYGKAARYLTEDSSGVKAFLKDLENKGYASLQKMADGTEKWSFSMKDLYESSQNMGMGFEFFMDMFGRLEDYGFSNNFVTSQEQGIQKIVDKTVELSKEKQKLAEMERTGKYRELDDQGIMREMLVNDTVLNAQREKVASLEADVESVSQNLEQFVNDSIDATVAKVEQSKEVFDILKQKYDELEADPNKYGENTEAVKKKLTEQLKTFAAEAGLELDGNLNIVNKDEVQSELESEPVELPIDINASFDEVKEKAQNSLNEVQKMVFSDSSITKVPITLDLEADNAANIDAQIASIIASVDKLKNENGIIDISAPGAQDVINVLMALIARKQEIAQPVIMSVDTGKLDGDLATVIGKLQEFQTAYNELERLNTLKAAGINVDTSDAQTKLNNITSEIQNLDGKQAEIMAKVVPDTSSVDSISATLSSMEPEVLVNIGVNSDAIANYNPEDKDADVNYHVEDSKIQAYDPPDKDAIVKYSPDTSGLPTSFTPITRTVNYVKGSDPGKASGTMLSPAHVNGTAYNTLNMSPAHASGNVAIQRDEKALVNELPKPESIVRDGIWSIIPGGAHVEQLKKGDIIFNGEQTEQLLKHGSISGHGRAYADGTVGNVRDLVRKPLSAYAGGAGHGQFWGGASATTASSSSKKDKTTNQISKNTKETADTVKDISNELSNYEDWIERRFKAIESEFAHLEAVFERMSHLPDRLAKAYDLLAKNKEYINTVNSSKSTYQAHLDRIKGQGLSQDIIDKIQNGSLEISNYSEETKKLISEYETYYNKLRDCSSQYDELLAKQAELVQSTLDSITDYYDMMNGVDESSKDILEAQRELYEKLGVSVTAQDQKDSVNNSIKEQEKITDRLAAQVEAYASQIESLISSGYMERYSKEYYAAHETLNGLKQELLESQSALIEFQDKLYELEYAGIQNLINGFERAVDKLDAKIAYIKSKDEKVSESLYQEQINANNSQIREKMKLKAKKEKEQALYDVGSTRYQELADEINNLDKETYELLTTNEELKDSIFELRFADLEKEIKGYQDLRNEIEDFRSLLDEEAFFDKNGAITEDGLANLALLQQGMISAKKEIADYREGLDKLQESFDNGVISETEYNEKSAEYREGIRDSIKDVNDYEDSLKDLYITQMSKEVEALNEVIEKRKEALKRKADYYDYDKKLKSETKDVNLLKAQIAALEGSNNLSAKSEVKRLKEQLAEAEDQLNETKRQHSLDMQEQGYDGLSSDLEKMLEDTQYEITHNADKQQEVISNMLNNVVNMYANAYDKINSIIANTGFVGSSGFNTNQGQLGSQSGAVSQNNQATQHQSNVKPSGSASSTVTKPIENDKNYHDKVEQELDKKPNTDNRLVAEVKLSTTSITLEEGKSTRISCTVRPNDAKNKSILWDTSDTRIISVSDSGTITALRPGSCLVTAATLDGSGIKVSAGVTVTKKPEPPKPQPQAPSVSTGSGGDGKPNVGDAVTFVSGRYYYSSDGNSPSGNQMLGQTVYIGHINNKPWATRPYAIYRDKAFKQGLGWVTLDQIKGYKKGTKSVPKDGIAWTQEGSSGKSKPELIVRKKDGAIITDVHRGDAIIPNNLTENLFEWGALSPKQMLGDMMMKPVMPMINNKPELNVVNNYDSLIRVDGNVDNNVLTELKHYEKEFLNKSRDYTMNYFNRELRKGGFRK